MTGLPSVPDDYEEDGDRDMMNTDGIDPGDIQGAAGVDERRHQGGEPQAIIHAEDGGRAIVGRVLQASRSVIGRVMGVDPGVRQDQAAEDQAGQQGPVEDGVEFESADDAAFETKSLHGDEGEDGTQAADVSAAAVFGDHEHDELPPSAEAIDTAPAHDVEPVEMGTIVNFDAAIAAGDTASARHMFLEIVEAMSQLSKALDVVGGEKSRLEATIVELENEIVEKEGEVLALSQDLSAKDQVCKDLQDCIKREKRVAAENIVIAAGEKEGIDAVFAEIPPNGGSVTKFAKAAGDYITTRSTRRRTIALSGVQGNVDWVTAGEAITAFGENTERLVPGRAANDNKFMEVMETLSKATDMLEESGFDSTVSSMPARAEKDPTAKTSAIADAAGERESRHWQLTSPSGAKKTFSRIPVGLLERWCRGAANNLHHLSDVGLILRHHFLQRLAFFVVVLASQPFLTHQRGVELDALRDSSAAEDWHEMPKRSAFCRCADPMK